MNVRTLACAPLAVLLVAFTQTAQPAKSVSTADGRTLAADAVAIVRKGTSATVVVATATQKEELPLDEIVDVTLAAAKPPQGTGIRVILAGGDSIYGTFREKGENSLKVAAPTLGDLEFKLDHVLALHFLQNAKAIPSDIAGSEEDSLTLVSGDVDRGIIDSITPEEVVIDSTQFKSKRTVKTKEVAAIAFARIGAPLKIPATPYQIVVTVDGTTVSGAIATMDDKRLEMTTLLGASISIPIANVAGFAVKNGRVIWISDMDPIKVDENPNYIRMEKPLPGDLAFPFQRNGNVLGGPMAIAGKHYRKGVGVHSRSRLTYRLDKQFKTFAAEIGIDDCASGNADFKGDVLFEIFADGAPQPLYSSDNVRGGESPKECRVDVSQVVELTLVVGFGNEGNIRDYADWGAARLLKK